MDNPDLRLGENNYTYNVQNDEVSIANNFNIILELIHNYTLHDVLELNRGLDYCIVMINICKRENFSINLYSRHSRIYTTLRDSGLSEEELFNNKHKYFPDLNNYDVESICQELIPIFDFLIKQKSGICENFTLSYIFSNYKVKDLPSFTWSLREYLTKSFKFGYLTRLEISLNIQDEYDFMKKIKSFLKFNKYSYKSNSDIISAIIEI
nr:hypothetical protein [Crinivirus sp.]